MIDVNLTICCCDNHSAQHGTRQQLNTWGLELAKNDNIHFFPSRPGSDSNRSRRPQEGFGASSIPFLAMIPFHE